MDQNTVTAIEVCVSLCPSVTERLARREQFININCNVNALDNFGRQKIGHFLDDIFG